METRYTFGIVAHLSWTLILLILGSTVGASQEVIISSDIDLRQDKKYVVLGKKKDHILLFRDRINKQEVDVLDTNLKLKYTREVNFNREDPRIIAVLPSKDESSIIYTTTDRDTLSFHQHIINDLGEMKDTIELGRFDKKRFKSNFKYAFSEDQTKVAVFNNGREDKVNIFVIDLEARKILWETEILEYDKALDYRFKYMILTNREDIIMLYEKGNNRAVAKTHAILLTHISEGMTEPVLINFEMPQNLSKDIHLAFDEGNNAVLILGLFTEANRSAALGYFYFNKKVSELTSSPELIFHQFDEFFIQKVNGSRRGVNNTLDYYFIKDVIFQQDGGFVWVGEMYKEYIRRSPSPYGRTNGLAGYVDHYTEDIIIVNVGANDDEVWKNVIYKKQFSQDDDAIYSSFGVMKNPSRLQLIFNDEIKRNNTVSTYALDPVGNMQRRTVLNTEYENLKLRFQEAEQISDNSMLVVSEGSGVLNLVKITF